MAGFLFAVRESIIEALIRLFRMQALGPVVIVILNKEALAHIFPWRGSETLALELNHVWKLQAKASKEQGREGGD